MQVTKLQMFLRAEKWEKSQQQLMSERFLCTSTIVLNLQTL